MSPRTGRPTDDPKINEMRIRLSNKDLAMLNYCCKKTNLTKAAVIRQGIRETYEKLKK